MATNPTNPVDVIPRLIQMYNVFSNALENRNQQWKSKTTNEYFPQGMPNPMDMYGGPGLAMSSIGVLPERLKIAREVIKRGLKEPWFHGTPNTDKILPRSGNMQGMIDYARRTMSPDKVSEVESWVNQGFDPNLIGSKTGHKLGEPTGISVTRDPAVAKKFGDILRVGVDVHPSSVGQLIDPEVQKLFREAYSNATSNYTDRLGYTLPRMQKMGFGPNEADVKKLNQSMSDWLRSKGLEALLYNPRRWDEYEMRVLDPKKAIPLGVMPNEHYGANVGSEMDKLLRVFNRYQFGNFGRTSGGLSSHLERMRELSPESPVRLHEILHDVK